MPGHRTQTHALFKQRSICGQSALAVLLTLAATMWQCLAVRAQQPAVLAAPTHAHSGAADRTYFGQDIYIAPGQQIRNATCFFCSVQVEGDLSGHAFVIFGNSTVLGQVGRRVTVIGGNAVIDAQARILGTTTVLGGNAVYESDESLSGNAWVLGGHVSSFARGHRRDRRYLAVSPAVASGVVTAMLLLLLPLFFARHPPPRRV